jgi:L-threonylcarbamoyladenylate synthase
MADQQIAKAAAILHAGGLVAFPTETVYGLGADASNTAALEKIFAAKQRPADHPLIVHLADVSDVDQWAAFISEEAQLLAEAFWPGPLTMIFQKLPHIADLVTGGQDTIALRIPHHPVALSLLQAFGGGVAAPSANRYGRISPTTAQAVTEELGESVDLVLQGGQCQVGVESTIVDVSGDEVVVLRPGMITTQQIEKVLQTKISTQTKNSPRVSGSGVSHYAPQTPAELMRSGSLISMLKSLTSEELPVTVLTRQEIHLQQEGIDIVTMPTAAFAYAHDLYATLRMCDKKNYRRIIIESVPETAEWDAIRDRLQRATFK